MEISYKKNLEKLEYLNKTKKALEKAAWLNVPVLYLTINPPEQEETIKAFIASLKRKPRIIWANRETLSQKRNIFRLFGGPLAELLCIIFDIWAMIILMSLASPTYLPVVLLVALMDYGIFKLNIQILLKTFKYTWEEFIQIIIIH